MLCPARREDGDGDGHMYMYARSETTAPTIHLGQTQVRASVSFVTSTAVLPHAYSLCHSSADICKFGIR